MSMPQTISIPAEMQHQLELIVEQVAHPVRAGFNRRKRIREDLYAHVEGIFREESEHGATKDLALERTRERFGDTAELTKQIQATVPRLSLWNAMLEHQVNPKPGDSLIQFAIRILWMYTLLVMPFTFIVTALQLVLRGMQPYIGIEILSVVVAQASAGVWASSMLGPAVWMGRSLISDTRLSRPVMFVLGLILFWNMPLLAMVVPWILTAGDVSFCRLEDLPRYTFHGSIVFAISLTVGLLWAKELRQQKHWDDLHKELSLSRH